MEWNVYRHNINKNEIEVFNIFDHGRFCEDVRADLKKYNDKQEFSERLKSHLMYYYLCKSEYEILVSPWIGSNNGYARKVDIYNQVMLNWDKFADYCWSFK